MIISHKHKFIFIKTRKTAGTSLEIALSRYLGPTDIVTPITPEDERERLSMGFVSAQNYKYPSHELGLRAVGATMRRLGAQLSGTPAPPGGRWPMRFYNHISAQLVRERIGEDTWSRYYKFSIERNPWDTAVSLYFWRNRDREEPDHRAGFKRYVLAGAHQPESNYDLYSIDGRPVLDFVVRYESLERDLAEVSTNIGLPQNIHEVMKSIRAKGRYRRNTNYRDMYDDESRDLIAAQCAREIELFNYTF
jgi:hypothetical protein